MTRRTLAAVLIGLFGLGVWAIAQSDVIELDYGDKLFKSTQFAHKMHAKDLAIACDTCHHTGDQVSCGDCHKLKKVKGVPKAKNAFHKQCRGCHQTMRQKGKTSPVSCTGCHEKK